MTRMVMILNMDYCTGCKACVLACSFIKEKCFDPSRARIRIIGEEREGLNIPITCEHCTHPPCERICPVTAIHKSVEKGIVLVDSEKCTGCGLCRLVCPFGVETIAIRDRKAIKCDLCNGQPECVSFCLPGALKFVEETPAAIRDKKEQAEKRCVSVASLEMRRAF